MIVRTTLCCIGAYLLFIACSMALPEREPANVSNTQTTSPGQQSIDADLPEIAAPQKPVERLETTPVPLETTERLDQNGETEPAVE